MGLFITHAKPTALMKKEAASAGVIDTPFGKFARLQILTINTVMHETLHAVWHSSNQSQQKPLHHPPSVSQNFRLRRPNSG